jgi:hypothetical protein
VAAFLFVVPVPLRNIIFATQFGVDVRKRRECW